VYTVALGGALLVLTVLLYFEQTLNELWVVSPKREPMFLIAVGVLAYFATYTAFFLLERGIPGIEYRIMLATNTLLCIGFHCYCASFLAG